MLKHPLTLLCLAALLAACSQQPDPPADAFESSESAPSATIDSTAENETLDAEDSDDALQRLAQDPEALREAMRDPEQRRMLMEAMQERREARRAADATERADREALQERMRERRAQMMAEREAAGEDPREQLRQRRLERGRWWADDDLKASIGLAEAQAEALTEAQLRLEDQRQTLRQQLGEQQQALMKAANEGDRSTLLQLIEQRSMTQQSLQSLELEWWRTMLDELTDDQLAALAEQNPDRLIRRGRL